MAKKSTHTASTDSQTSTADSKATSTASEATQAATSAADQSEETTQVDPQAQQIVDLKAQLDEKDDQLLRAQAEIVNMQNRNKKEQAALLKYDGQALAKDVLPVLDNLERALATQADDEAAQQLKKGVEMVYGHLQDALKKHGVTEVAAAGEKFDPNIHQAVQTVPVDDDHPADTVVQVLQRGYLLKDRTLRPAMVVVAQ
ncbi:nucleotide exchange factor GrpE [Lactiplantibacillus paraplantarum]|uniref:Protein GrpE n=1 Tax=Lactiplantibacillus paraplantarum TaxID=60520 RepID=A0A4V2L1R0_9LACO|nr:nucleotide exchange factor GrpE [Lactiplantibacillus paraplantarum]AVW10572.1 nucleotide exchange factor GrpE [Lactiplantibacillus paraplantarum]AYJ38814.1 nucleotide exchange factor GrpE [Lactiplantibacillus paraplantarum]MCU4683905.1 nucleotide exchange factor GrpE [Lactiplantibacillus paraplantarum]MDL2061160.1 nucleotide exchange factor GrpE [Lactiplantibacillus paraplantarum]TBX42322.1 nucleotide exchange factor GrpE [Lactiplantibacillus paraplantarum]